MAVAIVGSAQTFSSSTSTSYTFTSIYNVATGGANTCIVAIIGFTQNAGTHAVYPNTTATYGGVSMTYAIANNLGGNNEAGAVIMYLMNPPTGAQSLVVNPTNDGARGCSVTVVELSGVDSSDPLGATATVVSSTSVVSITTEAADSLVVSMATARDGDSGPFTPNTDVTELYDYSTGTSNFSTHAGMSGYKAGTAASTVYAMGGTPTTGGTNQAASAAEFKASAGGSTESRTITIAGTASSSISSASINSQTITPAGVASVSFTAASVNEQTLTAAGIASLSLLTGDLQSRTIAIPGQGNTSFLARSIFSANLAVSGVATPTFVAGSIAEALISVSGVATADFENGTAGLSVNLAISGAASTSFLAASIAEVTLEVVAFSEMTLYSEFVIAAGRSPAVPGLSRNTGNLPSTTKSGHSPATAKTGRFSRG